MAHSGSWSILGQPLPDFGVTEKVSDLLGGTRNAQGGSQLVDDRIQNAIAPLVQPVNIRAGQGQVQGASTSQLPTNQPTTQPTNQPTGGGTPNPQTTYVTRNGETKKLADWQSEGIDPYASAESSINWDQLYAPVLANLESMKGTATENANSLQGEVELTKENQLKRIAEQQKLAENKFTGEEAKIENKRNTALESAIRAYNAMQQQGISRFGGASSAGRAVGELASQEYFRNQGNITQSFNDLIADIQQQKASAYLAFVNANEEINLWSTTEIGRIKRELNNQIASINQSIASTQAEKNAKRAEVLDRSIQEARQIKAQKEQAQYALDIWKEQQNFLIENNLVNTYQNYSANTNSFYQPTQTQVGTSTSTTPNNTVLGNLRWNPQKQRFEGEDNQPLEGLTYS